MSDWKIEIEKEWNARKRQVPTGAWFPLIAQSFQAEEIVAVVDTLLTGQLTMGSQVKAFEQAFAKYVGAEYAVMVNSGSSANLLALAVACNPARKMQLKPGDEVLVPAVAWSTSVWPILQQGLKPVFVDVDPATLNVDLKDLKRKLTPKTKGMVAVHILGNCTEMSELLAVIDEHRLILIEDTCESLGSTYQHKTLGTLGDFGTYSFYYSHHLTTGEGGMVVCKTLADYDLLKCLRAHGWSRELSNRQVVEEQHAEIDPRFLFVNTGYNVRPMEVQAMMGLCQLKKIDQMNDHRIANFNGLKQALESSSRWQGQFLFPKESHGVKAVWFGFPLLLNQKLSKQRKSFLEYLSKQGVENRPIVSGNFTRQPGLKLHGVHCVPESFVGAEQVNDAGFFIGLHTELLTQDTLGRLAEVLLKYEFS